MAKLDKNSKFGLFVSHVVPGVIRPMRVLWHEIFGFIFLVLATIMGFGMFRSLGTQQATPGRVVIAAVLVLTFLYFGVTSFLKARKIGRS